ncbi:glycoside hydrolase family 97 protein [Christiangramia forsetii]|uniref:Alpha-glucosidase n=2 Tax=Christiangramia forsetii TaxID=411153 RepID=A0LZ87_CHRFK|nr:glycoside hydrolase family 97 protein [Christiangramia forsetii]GGG37728.1 alpha-glucosidase [Christiangramia forsetii]CAL65682.1 alpha-glucosidase [Christiangramia forsetii KT0803]
MRINQIQFLLILSSLLLSVNLFAQTLSSAKSPDANLEVILKLNENGSPLYQIQLGDKVFLEESPLGMKTSIGDFSENLNFISSEVDAVSETYQMDRAKISQIDYKANELISTFTNQNRDTLKVIFSISDNDVAFSYRVIGGNQQTKIRIHEETTGFNLPDDATTYISPQSIPMIGWENTKPSYEEEYTLNEAMEKPSQYGVGYTFPALFRLGEQGWLLLSETGVHGQYVGSRLGEGSTEGLYSLEFPQEGENNGIGDTFPSMALPAQTPWRTITIGKTLKPIVESTVMFDVVKPLYNASEEYKMGKASWSWIVWQDDSMNYDDQVKFIDLAADLEFEYILIDANWDRNIGYERMEELINYADSKNVKTLLWYNSNGYWNNAPQTPQDKMHISAERKKEMKWMQDLGVKGIKVDFFGGDKQPTMQLYEDILTDANEYGLGVTFHGCTLSRGWQRMFPNFVSSEAVLASENLIFRQEALDKHALNATLLPFTRNAVGAMDFAPVFLNDRLSQDQENGTIRSTTDAFELATSVLYFSPIQHFGLTPNNLEEQPEFVLDFLKNVPTTWDETLFISGTPEKEVVLARRKDEKWYISAVNGEKKAKKLEIELPMLTGQKVQMIFDKKDGSAGNSEIKINENGLVTLELLPEGGAVLINN